MSENQTLKDPRGCPISARAAAFDPFSPAWMACPGSSLGWSRAEEPVFWSPALGYWVVSRYEDVKSVFRRHDDFSPANALEKITPTVPEVEPILTSYGYAMNRTLVNEDEPAHMARRRLLIEPFTPPALAHHEPTVRSLAHEYIDRFIDAGHADLVDAMLWEVPLTVAMHFLGIPEDDMPTLRRYSVAHTVNTWGRPKPEEQIGVAHAVGSFWQYSGRVLEKLRATPDAPGWMPFAIRMQQDHPDVVTDSFLHSMMMAGIVAAHETTAHATANALQMLLERPAAWRALCEDPSLIPGAIEECLRLGGSIVAWRRVALKDTQLGGIDLPRGAKLLIVMASANRDASRFPEPDAFDPWRDNAGEHLSFGYGAHQCLGKNLARMEMRVFLEAFTRRLPHMRLAPGGRRSFLPNISFRGPEHLDVEWSPADNPERTDPARRDPSRVVVGPDASPRAAPRPLVVVSADPWADAVLRIELSAADGSALPRWEPGAHLDIECGAPGISRQYSLCGDPADRHRWTIAVLREPAGRGGSAWLHQHAKVGARLKVRGPRSHFRFDGTVPRALLVAGGIGITPIAAMAWQARDAGVDYTLHYAGRSRARMAMLDELQALHGERLRLHVGDEGGRLEVEALLATPLPGCSVHACGPQRLLDALSAACRHWPAGSLQVEHFHAEAALRNPALEHAFEAELKDSGLVVPVRAGQTLLDALRGVNIDVRSDCGEGLCGSCEVRVLAGDVAHRDRVLTAAERAAGDRMMSCCSRAATAGGRLVLGL